MDVSADLTELGRTPMAVICAGAKSILDIPRTLEYLETQACQDSARIPSHCHGQCLTGADGSIMRISGLTMHPSLQAPHRAVPCWVLISSCIPDMQGVTVAAYGADEFPAFFTRHSGCRAPARLDSPEEAAAMLRRGLELGLGSGAVIGGQPGSSMSFRLHWLPYCSAAAELLQVIVARLGCRCSTRTASDTACRADFDWDWAIFNRTLLAVSTQYVSGHGLWHSLCFWVLG